VFPPALAILFLACLHEDVAILAAGFFVVEHGVSPWLAGVCALAGMLINNLTLFLLGAQLRNRTWMQRWLLHQHAPTVRQRLERHLLATLALARLSQTMLAPTLVGCGSLHIPLQRVWPKLVLSAALHVSVLLTLVIALGATVMRDWSRWTWVIPAALIVVVAPWIVRRYFTLSGK
jgi:membrane protein DedA with SNARE-associated domain